MIVHIVLFKWKEETAPEAIARVMKNLRGLKEKIPGIIELSCGENFSERAKGFQHGLVVKFSDRPALDVYQPHPAHQEVVQNLIKPIAAEIIALDYEI